MFDIAVSDLPLLSWYVLVLVFLEGLLSADNALVLAVMVRHLPKAQQKRALRYGIWGAFVFRFIAVLLSAKLIEFWQFKFVGGLYLIYLAVAHFVSVWNQGDQAEGADASAAQAKRFGRGFWGTVVSVELADIAFSIDSILAAVAMADDLPNRLGDNVKLAVVYIGGILGILTMRFVAGYFILLLERFPGLANGAYGLVAWIGAKLTLGGLHDHHLVPYEMTTGIFWSGMLLIAIFSLITGRRPPETKVDGGADQDDGGADQDDGGAEQDQDAPQESIEPV